jgi:hypothetical protein
MSNKTSAQRAARLLQKLTGWEYVECLRLSKERDAAGIEVLARARGTQIDPAHADYAAWRKRAGHAAKYTEPG